MWYGLLGSTAFSESAISCQSPEWAVHPSAGPREDADGAACARVPQRRHGRLGHHLPCARHALAGQGALECPRGGRRPRPPGAHARRRVGWPPVRPRLGIRLHGLPRRESPARPTCPAYLPSLPARPTCPAYLPYRPGLPARPTCPTGPACHDGLLALTRHGVRSRPPTRPPPPQSHHPTCSPRQHLGIPSLDLAFSPQDAPYGVYHSVFDSFEWMDSVGDPGFKYHVAMAQLWGLIAIRLAGNAGEAPAPLPLNFTLQADAIGEYIGEAKRLANASQLDFAALVAAHASFASAARTALHAERAAVDAHDAAAVEALNERLAYTERHFLLDGGLPGRKYFKHCLQAPGLYTGYAPKTLPGVYDAVSSLDWPRARAQAALAAAQIEQAAAFLRQGSGRVEAPREAPRL